MMKTKSLCQKAFVLMLLIMLSFINVKSQETFTRQKDIQEGKCVVYIFREPNINGAIAEFKIRVWELYDDFFNYESTSIYVPYARLNNKKYVPVVLEADKLYRIYVSNVGNIYFKGKGMSESLIRISGGSAKFACIAGTSYFTKKSLISKKFEKKLFADPSKMDELNADANNKLLSKIEDMTKAEKIVGFIEKRK